jgi:hypothetical protein
MNRQKDNSLMNSQISTSSSFEGTYDYTTLMKILTNAAQMTEKPDHSILKPNDSRESLSGDEITSDCPHKAREAHYTVNLSSGATQSCLTEDVQHKVIITGLHILRIDATYSNAFACDGISLDSISKDSLELSKRRLAKGKSNKTQILRNFRRTLTGSKSLPNERCKKGLEKQEDDGGTERCFSEDSIDVD